MVVCCGLRHGADIRHGRYSGKWDTPEGTPRPCSRNRIEYVPELRGAVAVGTLTALDPKSAVAEFRIRCGWYAARGKPADRDAWVPKRKVHPGLWKVVLRGVWFNMETYPNGPASGIANHVTLRDWERYSARVGWSGSLFLAGRQWGLSDGPRADICGGVLS